MKSGAGYWIGAVAIFAVMAVILLRAPNLAGVLPITGRSETPSHTISLAEPAPAQVCLPFPETTVSAEKRGLEVANCLTPAIEHWLVGGASTPGHTLELRIVNPGARAAAITLEAFGSIGPIALDSRAHFTVDAGNYTLVNLDALAPAQPQLAWRVAATGSRVTADLRVTAHEGYTPQGVAIVAPAAHPSRTLVFPVVLGNADENGREMPPIIRLLAPETDTPAQLQIVGPDGTFPPPGLEEVYLRAGQVVDISLAELPPGAFAIVVVAEQPITGAAQWRHAATEFCAEGPPLLADLELADTSTDQPGRAGQLERQCAWPGSADLAWLPAAASAYRGSLMVPAGVNATLVIVPDPNEEPSEVVTGSVYGITDFEIAPGTISAITLDTAPESRTLTISASSPVAFGVALVDAADPSFIAALVGVPESAGETRVTLTPTWVH
ncbi:MAG: DUF5719 family protein [Promicromonosporaceae bacterium]|nr:DUF5719 family protein [Promicromonosporaceae bacterium]